MPLELKKLVKSSILGLQPYKTAKSIDELQREHPATPIIKIGSNENPLGASPKVMHAIETSLQTISRYPDPTALRLKTRLAKCLQVDPAQIILGNGSAEILSLITQTFLEPHDHVILPEYSFALFRILVDTVGAACSTTPLDNWTIDPQAIINAVTPQTKLIFIANPGNPTGTWLTHQQIEFVLENISKNTLLILDEAYIEYYCEANKPNAILLLKMYPNLIITRTFSKAYALAGMRLGYGIASSELIHEMNRIRLSFNLNSLAIEAGMAAINDDAHLAASISHNHTEMNKMKMKLDKLPVDYIPSAANFLSIHLRTAAAPIYNKLLQRGIITRTLENYGLPNYLGVTMGLQHENGAFIAALTEILNEVSDDNRA